MSNVIVSGKVVKVAEFQTPKGQLLVSFKVVSENVDESTGEVTPEFTRFQLCYESIEAGKKFAKALRCMYTATVEATKTVVTQGTKNPEVQFVTNYTTAKHITLGEWKTRQD